MGKVNTKDATGRTATLTGVRISYGDSLQEASLPKNNKDPNAKPKHGANLIIERNSEHFDSNKAAIISCLKSAGVYFKKPEDWWKTLFDDKPDNLCFKKGDRFKTAEGEIYKGYEGNLILALKGPAGGAKRPQIRDRYKKIIEDVSKINEIAYNGSYADAVVSFYGTDNGGTARLTGSIESLRSWQEGDRFGGGGVYVDDDDFDSFDDDDDSFESGGSSSSSSSSDDDFDL